MQAMTTLDRPTPAPNPGLQRQGRPGSDTSPSGPAPLGDLLREGQDAGLDSDSVYSYGLDGFKPANVEKSGASNPHDSIDLEGLAEQVYLLLRREAYIERERHGAVR